MTDKEKFDHYREVQMSGEFNMITEADDAAASAGLDIDDYFYVIRNYSALAEKYGD